MLTLLLLIHTFFTLTSQLNNMVDQELTIEVLGVSSYDGQVQVAVFNAKDDFPNVGSYQKSIPLDQAKAVKASFSIPAGNYAVAVYHDKNGNGKLDTNFMGIPKEDYGFSNNARGTMAPPSFEDAKVSVQQPAQTIQITLR